MAPFRWWPRRPPINRWLESAFLTIWVVGVGCFQVLMLRHLLGYPVKWQANRPPSDEVVILFMVAFGIGMVVASARILKLVFFHNKRPA